MEDPGHEPAGPHWRDVSGSRGRRPSSGTLERTFRVAVGRVRANHRHGRPPRLHPYLVSIHTVRAKARHRGIERAGPLAYGWTFRDGKVIHFRSFADPQQAIDAAGLSE